MPRAYDWQDSSEIGAQAVKAVEDFLSSEVATNHWYPIKLVESVEHNRNFQKRDVDLLVVARVNGALQTLSIEVKGDKNHHTGNFFLETVSHLSKGTPGAFLVTRAKWYFYYFLKTQTLYLFPTRSVRIWFRKHEREFQEKVTNSTRGSRGWTTRGRVVSIRKLLSSVPGCYIFGRKRGHWRVVKRSFRPNPVVQNDQQNASSVRRGEKGISSASLWEKIPGLSQRLEVTVVQHHK